jgi:hypothetical protein
VIVPQFWAEGRLQERRGNKQITVRRFGWSDSSQEDAQAQADARTREAFERAWRGEKLEKREPKVGYNGAEGVPIREEIVGRHGDCVITRNAYGARCLNTPDVLFVDIDCDLTPRDAASTAAGCLFALCGGIAGFLLGWLLLAKVAAVFTALAAAFACGLLGSSLWRRLKSVPPQEQRRLAQERMRTWISAHPQWRLRAYETPAGYRLLALHRLFDPLEPEVEEVFAALGADPVYREMCLRQRCFRARLTAKPWRAGIKGHLKPRPGVWPVNPARLPDRQRWMEAYDAAAAGFAACRFVEELGEGLSEGKALGVAALHDRVCGALSGRPLA